jgi:DNA-binding MarR family transcriptional regulator
MNRDSHMLDDRLGVLIAEPAIEELSSFFGSTGYLNAVQIFRAARMLSHRMNEASSGWLAQHNLTPAQYNFLAVLFMHDRKAGVSSRDVGKSLHTTSGTVTSMTDTLEQSGLIERVPHPSDRRSIVLKLTRKGERLFAKAAETHHAAAVAAMSQLSAQDMQTLLNLLVRAGNSLGALLADEAESGEKAG